MGEILFSCGSNKRAVVATLSVIGDDVTRFGGSKDEVSGGSMTRHVSIFSFFKGCVYI